jgi:hypothetical protein
MDTDQIDDMVLALLYLGRHENHSLEGMRAWKSFDWDSMNRLHEKGLITNPVGKTKSVGFTQEGLRRSCETFHRMFETED